MAVYGFDGKDQEKLRSHMECVHSWKTAAITEIVRESSPSLNGEDSLPLCLKFVGIFFYAFHLQLST